MADQDIDDLLTALTFPAWPDAPMDFVGSHASLDVALGLRRLSERAGAGDRFAVAALRFFQTLGEDGLARSLASGDDDARGPYAAACTLFETDNVRAAATRLGALVEKCGSVCELRLALALCAARLRRFDDARELALASLVSNPRHPRSLCLMGILDLLRGSKAEAQGRLALAARLARGQPEFREDMRTAQKLLLIRHLG